MYIYNKKDAKIASAHILQCLKIGILLLAKIVNGVLLHRRRQRIIQINTSKIHLILRQIYKGIREFRRKRENIKEKKTKSSKFQELRKITFNLSVF